MLIGKLSYLVNFLNSSFNIRFINAFSVICREKDPDVPVAAKLLHISRGKNACTEDSFLVDWVDIPPDKSCIFRPDLCNTDFNDGPMKASITNNFISTFLNQV